MLTRPDMMTTTVGQSFVNPSANFRLTDQTISTSPDSSSHIHAMVFSR
jgi:hypothetical protein